MRRIASQTEVFCAIETVRWSHFNQSPVYLRAECDEMQKRRNQITKTRPELILNRRIRAAYNTVFPVFLLLLFIAAKP
jgi:hypothetical protein